MADGIAAEALGYRGTGYVFGGPGWPPGDWDCSSFVTTMLLRRNLPVPGGGRWGSPGYPPNSHGPSSNDYLAFGAGVAAPEAGDLVVWAGNGPNGHIGISLGGDQMVSALNPSIGVQVSTLSTTKGGLMPSAYRRVAGAGGAPGAAPGGVDVTAAWNAVLPSLPPLEDILVPAAAVVGVVLVSVVGAGLLFWGGGLLVSVLAAAAATRAAGAVKERMG